MKNKILTIVCSVFFLSANAQKNEKISIANDSLKKPLDEFISHCLVESNSDQCIKKLITAAKDDYQSYLIANALYDIDPKTSFQLHEKVALTHPTEANINLEYAIELLRKNEYAKAIPLFLACQKAQKNDYRISVWLSECYLNTGEITKAIEYWNKSNHPSNHTGIDKAINIIHGKTDQIAKRSQLIEKVKAKDSKSAYSLIFLDLNWEFDWWNSGTQEYFLKHDLNLISNTFGKNSKEAIQLSAYNAIKNLPQSITSKDSITLILNQANMIIDNKELPPHGQVTSDLLRSVFMYQIIKEDVFFKSRGTEVVALADKYKDGELLNIYAYLESSVVGHVSPETDKKGWHEYKDERFAISYFIGLAAKNRYDNPDLNKAIQDFPNSSYLYWVKLNCAKIEGKDIKPDLIEFLKREFKSLTFDESRYSYTLKNYFYLLETEVTK